MNNVGPVNKSVIACLTQKGFVAFSGVPIIGSIYLLIVKNIAISQFKKLPNDNEAETLSKKKIIKIGIEQLNKGEFFNTFISIALFFVPLLFLPAFFIFSQPAGLGIVIGLVAFAVIQAILLSQSYRARLNP